MTPSRAEIQEGFGAVMKLLRGLEHTDVTLPGGASLAAVQSALDAVRDLSDRLERTAAYTLLARAHQYLQSAEIAAIQGCNGGWENRVWDAIMAVETAKDRWSGKHNTTTQQHDTP